MAYHDAPEVVPGYHPPEAAFGQGLEVAQPGNEVLETSQKYYDRKEAAILLGRNATSSNRICGLSKRGFWIVVIVAIVVIAGAVGGGVGGALAGKKSTSQAVVNPTGNVASQSSFSSTTPSSTSTPSTTSQIPATTTVTIAVATDMAGCPLVNNTIFTAPSTSTFLKICYFDILDIGNLAGIDEKEYSGVTTFDSCIGLCDSMNTVSGSKVCKAVVWDLEGSDYQDCWLKNSTQTLTNNIATGNPNGSVCAILQ